MRHDLLEQLASPDRVTRNRAALALGRRGVIDEEVRTALLLALRDSEWRVRGNAAKSIAILSPRDPAVLRKILELLSDQDEPVRYEAYEAIEHMIINNCKVDIESIDYIVSITLDSRVDVRKMAMCLFKYDCLHTQNSINAIVSAIKDPCEDVRYWAVVATAASPEIAILALPAMITSLKTDTDAIRGAILSTIRGLGEIGSSAASVIRELLDAEDLHIRFAAAYALVKIDRRSDDGLVRERLRQTVESSENADEKRLAAIELAELCRDTDKEGKGDAAMDMGDTHGDIAKS